MLDKTRQWSGRTTMAAVSAAFILTLFSHHTMAAKAQIEEVIVTAERREASVSDTSISITAFTGEMLEDFGIRNQSDLQNVIPATTIQPYDAAIRGVGRSFRNLGGDPGVSTYMNGVYSEDLYTATIGSLWDLERVEVLRGPQGTLYGRNAVGGAMNFLYRKPTDEFEGSFKTIVGSYGTIDAYGMISGPLIEDVLNSRLTYSNRRHDGWVEEMADGPDLDSGDEQNIALQFEWLINDKMSLNVRGNKAEVDRTFGGADGGGLIVLAGENTVLPTGDLTRNYDVLTNRMRAVDPTQTNPLANDFLNPAQQVFTYTNPVTGAPIQAQRVRPGIDPGSHVRNHGFGSNLGPTDCLFTDKGDIDGDDLCAYTNGLNVEQFDQAAVQVEFNWDISESVSFKYIFGYNDLLYERITEDDSSASQINDRQFYVNHEAEYVSHELQLFWDLGSSMTFTSGVFFYDSTIDQRYDFYSSVGQNQFVDPTWGLDGILAAVAPGVVPGDPPLTFLQGNPNLITVESAKDAARAAGSPEGTFQVVTGPWLGDASLGSIPHGIETLGSDLHSTNKTEREAFAAYTQGVWDINEVFTLTVGVRYAYDDITGEELLAQYTETMAIPNALGLDLGTINILRGAIDPATLELTGAVDPWLGGVPIQFGAFRELSRRDEKVTARINLDWNLNDDSLLYLNVTTGYRSGGFNLAFFSQTPEYEPEELIAYELGYKGRFLDNSLQFTGSVYLYDYESIHTRTEEACPPGISPGDTPEDLGSACQVVNSTTSIQAAPGAETWGIEAELLWLASENLTIGGNFSYTDTEYTDTFLVVDGADPTIPGAIYNGLNNPDRVRDLKGNPLPRIPEIKYNLYATYAWPLGDSGNVEFTGSYSYVDEVFFSAFQNELDRAPSYQRLDLRTSWTSADDTWVVSGFVNNVFDEIGIRQILRHGAADGYRRTAQVTEPRVYGLEVTYNIR